MNLGTAPAAWETEPNSGICRTCDSVSDWASGCSSCGAGMSTPTFPTMNGGHNCAGCGAKVQPDPRFTEHYPDCEAAA